MQYSIKAFPCFLTGSSRHDPDTGAETSPPLPAGYRLLIVDERGVAVGEAWNEFHGVEFCSEADAMACYERAPVAEASDVQRWNEALRPMVRDIYALEEKFWPKGWKK